MRRGTRRQGQGCRRERAGEVDVQREGGTKYRNQEAWRWGMNGHPGQRGQAAGRAPVQGCVAQCTVRGDDCVVRGRGGLCVGVDRGVLEQTNGLHWRMSSADDERAPAVAALQKQHVTASRSVHRS